MIILHRKTEDPEADEIVERLDRMVLGYKTRIHHNESSQDHNESSQKTELPRIEEGEKEYVGEKEIRDFLDELDLELGYQRSITSDACYLDPDTGEIC